MQIQSTIRCYKEIGDNKFWQGYGRREHLCTVGRNVSWYIMENSMVAIMENSMVTQRN